MVRKMADKQNVSALMDGESVDTESILAIESDQQQQQAWRNYHLIGDVMRGDAPEKPEWNIADSIAAAIENEPSHHRFSQNETQLEQNNSVEFLESQPEPKQTKKALPTWLTQFGQVAIAASVSLAVIVGVQQYGGEQVIAPQVTQAPGATFGPSFGSAEPVSLTRQPVVREQATQEELLEQRSKVHAILQDYELQLRLNQDVTDTAN
jgi:sigma-E factor negative regulatory protein RseA